MDTKHFINSFTDALVATMLLVSLLGMSYFVIEPSVGRAQDTSGPFTINQVITGETSFLVDAASTTLSGSLNVRLATRCRFPSSIMVLHKP
jgi:hypothetical protein